VPASETAGIISEITFPAYSRLQEDLDELRGALLQTTRLTAFIAFPLSFGIAAVAPSFVPAILGEEWRPMITAMQILAMYGLLHAVTRNFGAIWKALDRPDLIVKTGLIRVACIAALIWPATAAWGIEGTALVVVGVYVFPMLPLDVYLSAEMVEARQRQLYAEYLYPFVAASVMFGTLWYVSSVTELTPLVEFLVLVPSGAVAYFAAALLLERQFDWGIERNLRMISDGLRG
jgi:PST family polysaccharide transporter/lipopolysaccharide exporter